MEIAVKVKDGQVLHPYVDKFEIKYFKKRRFVSGIFFRHFNYFFCGKSFPGTTNQVPYPPHAYILVYDMNNNDLLIISALK